MLLIVGAHIDKFHDVARVASDAGVPLMITRTGAALKSAIASSPNSIVLLHEQWLSSSITRTLNECSGAGELSVLVVESADGDKSARLDPMGGRRQIRWLPATCSHVDVVTAVRTERDAMFHVTVSELRRALDKQEFVIQYQPKVEWFETEELWRTTEAEALIRWRHPEHGLLGPGHFIGEAQRLGLMEEITEFVLQHTLKQINSWDARGLELGGCVNVAPSVLDVAGLTARYAAIVAQYGIECSRISFEIPANDAVENLEQRAATITELRAQGFRISLDDFGATPNCMRAFEVLEFDEIKLHATLLRAAQDDQKAQLSLAALTGLAHNIGLSVCAEGVEYNETVEFLREIRCNKMQGYLVSEAVMPEIIRSCYDAGDAATGDASAYAHLI